MAPMRTLSTDLLVLLSHVGSRVGQLGKRQVLGLQLLMAKVIPVQGHRYEITHVNQE